MYFCNMIIKKQICLLLALFLLLSQNGAAFNVHFCNSKIASIAFQSDASSANTAIKCCGEIEKNKNCCSNKIIKSAKKAETVFLKSYHFLPELSLLYCNNIPVCYNSEIVIQKVFTSKYFCSANAPPIFTLNCQFLFYA